MPKTNTTATNGKLNRTYSQRTIKILFGLSGNQCAHPHCTNTVIEPATAQSDAAVIAQICHIYAISEKGPRGKPGLTQEELNLPSNLILLCRDHHAVVDTQHETYPAERLQKWKNEHEAPMQRGIASSRARLQPDILGHAQFPTGLVDTKIEEEIDQLRKSRFFPDFERVTSSTTLGRRLVHRELSGGSDHLRCQALAWSARVLSGAGELDMAQEFLKLADQLGTCEQAEIARAFILSYQGDKAGALHILATLDTPGSRSAALMVVVHHDGAEMAFKWLQETETHAANLDSDGKSCLLMHQLKHSRLDAALETLGVVYDCDFKETPFLHHLAGIAKLLSVVPTDLRAAVLERVPFAAAEFPLASDALAMQSRREAHRYIVHAREVAQQLNSPYTVKICDEYALWLELRDPEQRAFGKTRLEAKLRDPKTALGHVYLGLQFGIDLSRQLVERDIDRDIAKNGKITADAALARFALAYYKKSPREVADYLVLHYDQLAEHINTEMLLFRQAEMFARAGLADKAKAYLDKLVAQGVSEEKEKALRRIIAESQGENTIEARKQQFHETGSLGDLINLVDALEAEQQWEEICDYGKRVFDETHSLRDAERLVAALSRAGRSETLVAFLSAHSDLKSQSRDLELSYAWGLYIEGKLLESRDVLARLDDDAGDPNFRALQFNLAMALGDVNSLSAWAASEYRHRNTRNAPELLQAARMAVQFESPHAKDLLSAAVEQAGTDANVLAGAYFLATRAGWEDDPKVFQWLERAAQLSGEHGPIRHVSFKDILASKPEWDLLESETWRQLAFGEVPIFSAARSLNRSLVDLTIFPAFGNLSESDPRRRNAIPAYCGNRNPERLPDTQVTIGLDPTALLTLSHLNLLDRVFDTYETVYISHSTLAWLFEELQETAFHQPSRIRNARRIRDLLATGFLESFVANTVPSSELSTQIGDELAALIAEAETLRDDDAQHIVVRPPPVYRVFTLMEEEADLGSHANVLSNCFAVVKKLRQKGQITAEEEKHARDYLHLREEAWANQPEIADGAVLYLSDLAISNFLHLNLLHKLKGAGLKTIASPKTISKANTLISYEEISENIKEAIDRLRRALNSNIEFGRVKVDRMCSVHEHSNQTVPDHPTIGMFGLATRCDAVIIDDRHINQHSYIDSGNAQTPIFTTLDLLDGLLKAGVISEDKRFNCRTILRRAGYCFVPLGERELECYLNLATIADGRVVESAELKAIRESILAARMTDWLQLPKEAIWLNRVLITFVRVLKGLWEKGDDIDELTARSDWIADQVDVRGWVHRMAPEDGDNVVEMGRGAHILLFLTPPSATPKAVTDAYWEWIEQRILAPIKEGYPELYEWLLAWHREMVSRIANTELTEGAEL